MYFLESPQRGDSNKYLKSMFSQRITWGWQWKNSRSADFCADRIDVITNCPVITNAVITRVRWTYNFYSGSNIYDTCSCYDYRQLTAIYPVEERHCSVCSCYLCSLLLYTPITPKQWGIFWLYLVKMSSYISGYVACKNDNSCFLYLYVISPFWAPCFPNSIKSLWNRFT